MELGLPYRKCNLLVINVVLRDRLEFSHGCFSLSSAVVYCFVDSRRVMRVDLDRTSVMMIMIIVMIIVKVFVFRTYGSSLAEG